MVPSEHSGPVNIFFVLHQRIPVVRREYHTLHLKIQELREHSAHPIKAWLMLMGDAPLALAWPWQGSSLLRGEPKCDLGAALRRVQELLRHNPAAKSRVIVWCMDGLGGEWQGPITELAGMPGVSLVVMAYQASQPDDGNFLRNFKSCKYLEPITDGFIKVVDALLNDFRIGGGAVKQPAAGAETSQAIAGLPVEPPAPSLAARPPSFQSLETVVAPLPPSMETVLVGAEIAQPIPAVDESPASSSAPVPQPAETELPPVPPPVAGISEYPDLSNGKLDEMLGPHSVPTVEPQTSPRPEPAGKSTPPPPPVGQQVALGPPDTGIVIDVSGIQAKPVKLEKSPLPQPQPRPENKPEPEPEPQPVPAKDVPANLWVELDPPADLGDRFDPVAKKKQRTSDGWTMVAASRRGKMHAHKALFREDAFALGEAAGWHFMVVADGGGSRPLARVGSNLAAEVAVNAMCEFVRKVEISELTPQETCRDVLEKGMRNAYEALQQEAGKRGLKLDDFGTTYLALAHKWLPGQKRHVVGVLQVGDGLIAALLANKSVQVLANADVGESASQTLFLTSRSWKDWLDRIQLIELEAEALMFASMCDGVSDDLIPYPRNLPRFFEFMQDIVLKDSSEDALLDFLKYEKRGSFDDRTLALLVREAPNPPAQKEPSAMIRRPAEFSEGMPGSPADMPEAVEKHLD